MNKTKLLLDINLFIRYNGTHYHLLNFDLHKWSEIELQELYEQLIKIKINKPNDINELDLCI